MNSEEEEIGNLLIIPNHVLTLSTLRSKVQSSATRRPTAANQMFYESNLENGSPSPDGTSAHKLFWALVPVVEQCRWFFDPLLIVCTRNTVLK
jgi:hypothetical protein